MPPTDRDMYGWLLNCRTAGNGDYHNLTQTYLVAESILVSGAVISFRAETVLGYSGAVALAVIGLVVAVQMAVAQSRFRAQNYYWEFRLKDLESQDGWNQLELFNDWETLSENNEAVAGEYYGREMEPNWGLETHRKWWAPRMKGLPAIFSVAFVAIVVMSLLNIF